ncbi:hypothetical protein COCSUDRAFT_59848 [Coccomyxa subellipsoidea C-169]|uniref:RHOMBOID-like protein n=1 Tax=Coccomyxa subellipsoidea (strain C-169) TaxID=574566 RepID=I0YKK6_COCSC|nr:hypothetical protein COCSUDRAFT_59848 [Coccomyxa subellipsoidea C-169]EIE18925.1 hypothetical protein COCSUDRAFT_59848 [Coccomyxa subellipsoidea C-169]|eukprot:XP_005643469.1 hypothetical protein COCSUDRAFT_59848 [Coccomyxa subellipsoidea C-169]
MEGSLRREYDGRRQPSPNLPMRPDHYAANLSDSHDLGPYSRAPTPQSDTSSTSRFGSFVDRGASSSSSSSHRMPSGQPRHASSRSATPLGSQGGGMAIGAVPSFRARGQVQEMGMAAAGSRLRGRGSHDGPARSLASVGHGAPFDVTPLGLSQSAPWPEVPLSPKTPQTPMLSKHGTWHTLDIRGASCSVSIPEDESVHSEGGQSASYRTPVLPKGAAPFYMDSAARESSDLESLPTISGTFWCCCAGAGRSALGRCFAACWHYSTLAFAEYPLRRHRQWMGAVLPCPGDGDADRDAHNGESAPDGRGGVKRRLPFGCLDTSEPGAKTQELEEFYANNRKRRRLAYALRRRKSSNGFKGAWDRISNDLFIFGELVFDRSTPRCLRHHIPWFTLVFLALQFITFAFMAGEYVSYLMGQPAAGECAASVFKSGPHALWQWVIAWEPCHTFQGDFLVLWGAKYAPVMRAAAVWWRWLSSLVINDSFVHLAAGALLFGSLGLHLERRYGTRRIAVLALICGIAGNFFDTTIMDPCAVVLAGAGCTVGLLGPFFMDILLNFDAIRYPVLRVVGVAGAGACFATAACQTGYPYRLTPLGGFLAGIFPGMVFMPHVKSEKYEWFLPFGALATSFVLLIVLPIVIYAARFPHMACP